MKNQANVKVVIVTYNGLQWIDACLSSCNDYEVIVVDNGSTDTTVNTIKQKHPQVVLLEQKNNLGFGQANNLGISYALSNDADYVLLLNQDAYLQPDTISKLIKVYNENKNYGIISPIHLNGTGTKLDRNFSGYLAYDENNFFHFDAINSNLSKIYEVPFVNAACWLVPKSTLIKIGGFDPIFFHYGEDNNYCQRLRYHGLKVVIVPSAFVKHDREFIKKGIKHKDLSYKLKWANINSKNTNDIKVKIEKLKKVRFKSFLKFNLTKVKYCNEELKLICHIIKEINKSRVINKKEGKHYI